MATLKLGILRPCPAVGTQGLQLLQALLVTGRHHPSVAERTKYLGWIEAEAPDLADGADRPTLYRRLLRLGAVFNNYKARFARNRIDCHHIRWMAVEMDRHDGARERSHRGFERTRVNAISVLDDIDQHRNGPDHADCRHGR